MSDINNMADVIDSRDIIERINNLENWINDEDPTKPMVDSMEEWKEELETLKELAEECADYASDWEYGEALIRDTYFEEYAQELAEDTGMVNTDATWPNNCIDWERAANELKHDYTSVNFDGVDYWIRAY